MRKKKKVLVETNREFRERELSKQPQTQFIFSWVFLIFFIFFAYAPFLGTRFARTAGDDKVYVSQALEMQRDGHWFVQTLADQPDYRKGPLHYIALRIGFLIFGHSMWATLYMNLIFVILGALAMAELAGRHLGGDSGWAFWAGTAFALNAGIFSHVFASQMEVELAAVYAIALFFLDRLDKYGKMDWQFWLVAALAGAIKSPLHSVLLGGSAVLFWFCDGSWKFRWRSRRAWLGLSLGILAGAVAYLPPLLFDFKNFMQTFFGRENFEKSSNGAPWHYPVVPILTYFLLPWMLAAFVAYADGLRRFWIRVSAWKVRRRIHVMMTSGHERLVILGMCSIIPSIVFFLLHPYRGQNYHLPVISGFFLLIAALWSTASTFWRKIYIGTVAATGGLILLVPIGATIIGAHFRPLPLWWSDWTLPALWIGTILTAKGFFDEAFYFHLARPGALARKSIWMFLGIAVLLVNIGEREMVDIRAHYAHHQADHQQVRYAYYNLHQNVWSEWGYLNFWADVPVVGMHNEKDMHAAIARGDYLLIPGEARLQEFLAFREKYYPDYQMSTETWQRWHTKGKNERGESAWKESWRTHDLSKLEKQYFILRLTPKSS